MRARTPNATMHPARARSHPLTHPLAFARTHSHAHALRYINTQKMFMDADYREKIEREMDATAAHVRTHC